MVYRPTDIPVTELYSIVGADTSATIVKAGCLYIWDISIVHSDFPKSEYCNSSVIPDWDRIS